jgi:hypothetical protein
MLRILQKNTLPLCRGGRLSQKTDLADHGPEATWTLPPALRPSFTHARLSSGREFDRTAQANVG